MGPRTIISTGAQPIPNFLIITMKQWNTIYGLPADVWMGLMRCKTGKNHMTFCTHVYHNCYYEAKTNG